MGSNLSRYRKLFITIGCHLSGWSGAACLLVEGDIDLADDLGATTCLTDTRSTGGQGLQRCIALP